MTGGPGDAGRLAARGRRPGRGRRGVARRRRHRGRGGGRARGRPGGHGAAARRQRQRLLAGDRLAELAPPGAAAAGGRAARRARCATRALGLLRMGGADGVERVFAVNAGIGLDAATVEWIEARPRTKRRLRQAGLRPGRGHRGARRAGRAPHLRVTADGGGAGARPRGARRLRHPLHLPRAPRPLDLVPGAAFDGRLAWVALTRLRPARAGPAWRCGRRAVPTSRSGPARWRGGGVQRELWWRATRRRRFRPTGSRSGATARSACRPGPVLRAVEPRPG